MGVRRTKIELEVGRTGSLVGDGQHFGGRSAHDIELSEGDWRGRCKRQNVVVWSSDNGLWVERPSSEGGSNEPEDDAG